MTKEKKYNPDIKYDPLTKKIVPKNTPEQVPDVVIKDKGDGSEQKDKNSIGKMVAFMMPDAKDVGVLPIHADKIKTVELTKKNKKSKPMKKEKKKPFDGKKIKVSTYSRESGLSLTSIYAQIKNGKLSSEKIDGVTFVIVNK